MSDDDLLKELAPQKITAVRRITKKTATEIVGTATIVLTINSTVVPEYINFGFIRLRTRLYYPQPLICRHCLKYGHPKNKCVAEQSCIVCSESHSSDNCTATTSHCGNCKGSHSPLDRKCPVYVYETAVLKIKTEKNITLTAARKLAESQNTTSTSYAAIVKHHSDLHFQQKKRNQQTEKNTQPAPSSQQNDNQQQQQQQQQQKRNHHPTEIKTAEITHSTISPPRKKCTSQPSPMVSEDESSKEPQRESDKLHTNSVTRKLNSENSSYTPPIPSTSPSNPFQPISLKKKFDPRPIRTCKK
ncbi:uncharacterized protein LOC129753057 [Uranotaenia lowii]|uniref:uncharacterized protein LOC129753057 n=1 Tax=Uranotaenia lowii TaxID=190385 RepID=UPI0024792BDE|nr:uncharacterized protein LOC129753057 [Uranotaenia lowii]